MLTVSVIIVITVVGLEPGSELEPEPGAAVNIVAFTAPGPVSESEPEPATGAIAKTVTNTGAGDSSGGRGPAVGAK